MSSGVEILNSGFYEQVLWILIYVLILLCISIALRYLFWRKYFFESVPYLKFNFFHPLGSLSRLPFSKNARNGYSLNVFALQFLEGMWKLFPNENLFGIWVGFFPFVVLRKPEAVEAIMKGNTFLTKGFLYRFLHPGLGTGLVTSDPIKWKGRRKLLNPCFHYDILKRFIPEMNKNSKLFVQKLLAETSKDFTNINTPISLCVADIVGETLVDARFGAQDEEIASFSQYGQYLSRGTELVAKRMTNCLIWTDLIYSLTEDGKEFKKLMEVPSDFTHKFLQEKKDTLLKNKLTQEKGQKMSFGDLLIKLYFETKDIDEDGIKEELITFLLAAADTTIFSLNVALYYIGRFPNVQAKIYQELGDIFGKDIDRDITEEDLSAMKYLECVIKESLRIYPPVPMLSREATEDANICGHRIPKGSTFIIFPYAMHRDEELYPNPEKFDPDRFLPENSENRHQYAYIPFSVGPRNCIGQRYAMMMEKIILSTLLRHFTIESLDEMDMFVPSWGIVMQLSIPIRIKFRARKLEKSQLISS